MSIPCSTQPSRCEAQPNPLTSYDAGAEDSQTFIGVESSRNFPRLGDPFCIYPALEFCQSEVSQEDADLCALRAVFSTQNPCATVYLNQAITVSIPCPDSSCFTYTVPAGLFPGFSQDEADEAATAYATYQGYLHRICITFSDAGYLCLGAAMEVDLPVSGRFSPFELEITSGSLPPGLNLIQSAESTWTIYGTPTTFGAFTFNVLVTDSIGGYMQREFTLYVFYVQSGSLYHAVVGAHYSDFVAFESAGSSELPSITSGAVPPGLTFEPSTGEISGTPTTEGDYTFTVGLGGVCEVEFTLSVLLHPTADITWITADSDQWSADDTI